MALTKVSYSMIQGAPVNVLDFGAIGDGVANDTVAIQAALASMQSTGGELFFPKGTYKITAPIAQEFNDGVNVKITGYGAKIDGTSVTGTVNGDTVLILLGGSTDSVFTKTFPSSALGANVLVNATSITSAGTFGVQPNDILLVTSTDLWNPTRIYYYKGEMVEVRSVSGTTIECSNGLFDGYTAATTTIYRLTMPYISVEGLEIEMNANQIGLAIHYSRNATVRNVIVHGARYSGIETFYCFGGLVDNCFVYDAWDSGSDSYGVVVATNQNFSVTNCTLTQARHCITSGGFEPNRLLNYSNNHCTAHPLQTNPYAIDVHGNAEYVIIANNYSEGIVCSGINASILGNITTANRPNSQAINIYQEINSIYYNISDNYIETKDSLAQGIWVSPLEDNLTINRLTISGNTVISVTTGILIQPRNATVTGSTILSCFVTGNIAASDSGNAFVIQHGVGSDQTVKRLSTANNNFSTNTAGLAFFIISTASIDVHTSTGDSYIAGLNSNLSTPCVFSGTDVKISNAYFDGFLVGGGGLGGSINYNNTGYIQVTNCTFKNLTSRASLLSASSTYIENGAIDETSSNVIVNTVNAKIITNYDSAGNAIASRTAAPTINTWGVGDVVWNSTPVVGQPKGWMCTVAGTPGTWVSMGNL